MDVLTSALPLYILLHTIYEQNECTDILHSRLGHLR